MAYTTLKPKEVVRAIDIELGTDWKSGAASEIVASVEASDDVDFSGNISVTGDTVIATKTPSAADDTGTAGTIAWDSNYIYICSATDTWLRAAIATWA